MKKRWWIVVPGMCLAGHVLAQVPRSAREDEQRNAAHEHGRASLRDDIRNTSKERPSAQPVAPVGRPVGRQLTAGELAELRQQLRQQRVENIRTVQP